MRSVLLTSVIFLLIYSCNSSKGVSKRTEEPGERKSYQLDFSLARMLSREPGVLVQGSGPNARIRIRGGNNSILVPSEPLFVLNDQVVPGGYSEIIRVINPADVKSIEVLKSANEIALWGSRGANGVIKITTK